MAIGSGGHWGIGQNGRITASSAGRSERAQGQDRRWLRTSSRCHRRRLEPDHQQPDLPAFNGGDYRGGNRTGADALIAQLQAPARGREAKAWKPPRRPSSSNASGARNRRIDLPAHLLGRDHFLLHPAAFHTWPPRSRSAPAASSSGARPRRGRLGRRLRAAAVIWRLLRRRRGGFSGRRRPVRGRRASGGW